MKTDKTRTAVTMLDVARLAEVSQGTVSNVLNGAKGVSSDKIKRVEAAVRELGYEQNALAKSLKANKNEDSIYVIFPNISEPQYEEIFEAISRKAEENHSFLNLFLCDELPYKEKQVLNKAAMFNVNKILIITCQPENERLFGRLERGGRHIVSLYREIKKSSFVGLDVRNVLIGSIHKQIAEGKKRIAMLTGPRSYSFDTACIDAYLNALFSSDIAIRNDYLLATEYDKESALQQSVKLLSLAERPEVIYVTSEILAEGVRKALDLTGSGRKPYPKLIIMKSRRWTDIPVQNEESIILPYGKMGERAFELLTEQGEDPNAAAEKELIASPERTNEFLAIRPRQSSGKEVRVLMPNNHAGRAVGYLYKDFQKKTGIRVRMDLVNYPDMRGTIMENKNFKYDVFAMDVLWLKELAAEGCIEPLESHIDDIDALRGRFPARLLDAYSMIDGKIWTLPFSFTTQLLFYRKDLFDKLKNQRLYYEWYKEELRAPRTWEEYNKVARFFTRKYNRDSDTTFGASQGGWFPTGATSEYLPRIWARDAELFHGETTVADRDKFEYALQNYVECYNYAHPDAAGWWWDDKAMDFCQGNSAMMVQFSDQVTILRDRDISHVIGKTGFAVVPGHTSLFGGWSIGMNRQSEAKEEAFEFIKWTMSEGISMDNAVLGRIVPYTSVRESTELLRLYPWHHETFDVFRDAKKRVAPRAANGTSISENIFENIIGQALHDAIRRTCTVREAVEKMLRELVRAYAVSR